MSRRHWSSCALSRSPAEWPRRCDCGGFGPERASWRMTEALRDEAQLWRSRLEWRRANGVGWAGFLAAACLGEKRGTRLRQARRRRGRFHVEDRART